MSANLYWEPLNRKKREIEGASAPSSFMDSLERAFGDRTPSLHEADVAKLEGMAAMFSGPDPNPYRELIDAIEKCGAISVTAEY